MGENFPSLPECSFFLKVFLTEAHPSGRMGQLIVFSHPLLKKSKAPTQPRGAPLGFLIWELKTQREIGAAGGLTQMLRMTLYYQTWTGAAGVRESYQTQQTQPAAYSPNLGLVTGGMNGPVNVFQ